MEKGTPKILCAYPNIYYIDLIELKPLMNAFIKSKLNYSPLVWVFYDRRANVKLRSLKELCDLYAMIEEVIL